MNPKPDQATAVTRAVMQAIPSGAPVSAVLDALITCYLNTARDTGNLRQAGRVMALCGPPLARGVGLPEAWSAVTDPPPSPLTDLLAEDEIADGAQAIARITVEAGMNQPMAMACAVTFLCAVAASDPKLATATSALMRAAADQLLRTDGTGFDGAFASVRPGFRAAPATH